MGVRQSLKAAAGCSIHAPPPSPGHAGVATHPAKPLNWREKTVFMPNTRVVPAANGAPDSSPPDSGPDALAGLVYTRPMPPPKAALE